MTVDPPDSALRGGNFIKPCCFVPVGVVPFVEARRGNVFVHGTVFKGNQTVIPPGAGQINAAGGDGFLAGQMAVPEEKALLLLQAVGRGGNVTDVPGIGQGTDFAVFKQGIASAAEMMNNVIGMLLVIGANTIARKASDVSLY